MKINLPIKLIIGVILGIVIGTLTNKLVSSPNEILSYTGDNIINVIVTIKHILGQFISFCVPLIVIGFISPSITRLGNNASRMLFIAIIIAYVSSLLASLLSVLAGYIIIPNLSIQNSIPNLKELPEIIFKLDIPQIMSVMSALVFSIVVGLSAIWSKAKYFINILEDFQKMILLVVKRIVIPLLPIFIGLTFAALSYEGSITKQLPTFLIVVIIVMIGHYIWLGILYFIAGIYSNKNPLTVLKHYGPAYITAVGTMSSAATLGVAIDCAKKSKSLRDDMIDFGIPLFANIHLCGSVLTEVFFVMTVNQILYGSLPSISSMILFCVLLGIFAIGAPGVPGGTVMASLGLIIDVLGFDSIGTALMLTIFALQDSFGTACNVTGDGALTLILTGYVEKNNIQHKEIKKID